MCEVSYLDNGKDIIYVHSIDIVYCQDFSVCLEHFEGWLNGGACGGDSSISHDGDDDMMMVMIILII